MLKMSYTLIGLILVTLILGCSKGESEGFTSHLKESQQIIDPSDSVGTDETSTEVEQDFEIQFVRETSYGSTDDIVVGSIGSFSVDGNNRVFIVDRNRVNVHVYQPEGNFLTSLGNQGRGPGEFMAVGPYTMIAIHSKRFYITDLADVHLQFPYRMHAFSLTDLSFIHTINLLAKNISEFEELDGYYPKWIYPFDDDAFLVSYHRSPQEYLDEESMIYYFLQDNSGNIVSGPVLKQKDRTNLITEVTDFEIPYRAINSFPFHGKSLLTVSEGDELFTVNHTEEFKIDVYTLQGDQIRTIEHAFENLSFNRNEILDYYKKINYGHRLGEGVALKMIQEAENLPETWPAIENMLIDDKNLLWISTIVEKFDIYEWWVLNGESGELITKFEWPRDEPIEVVKNGYIYTRQTDDETGLQQVVRYRIDWEEV
jgi:hypothetical protein